jgi:hypothetical protein
MGCGQPQHTGQPYVVEAGHRRYQSAALLALTAAIVIAFR